MATIAPIFDLTISAPPLLEATALDDPRRPSTAVNAVKSAYHRRQAIVSSFEYSVPNPPPHYVGRQRELKKARARLERASALVVVGPGGIGKTSFLTELVHHQAPDVACLIEVRPNDPFETVARRVLYALADASPKVEVEEVRRKALDKGWTASLVRAADAAGAYVILDDLHHCPGGELGELIMTAARYARSARWLATSRDASTLNVDLTLTLPQIDSEALFDLVHKIAPDLDEAAAAHVVRQSLGSPFLARRALGASAGTRASSALTDMDDEVLTFVRTLGAFHGPLPLSLLRELCPVPDESGLESLVRGGVLSRSSSGVRLHDLVIAEVWPARPPPEFRRDLATRLCAASDGQGLIEATRLLSHATDRNALVNHLEAFGSVILAQGDAPLLWQLIEPSQDGRLDVWKLRCGTELGNATVLASLQAPTLPDPRDQLAWAEAQLLMGDPEHSRELALAIIEAKVPDVLADATVLAARCDIALGEATCAIERLSPMDTVGAAALRALAGVHAGLGPPDESLVSDEETPLVALLDVAEGFYSFGNWKACERVLGRVLNAPASHRAPLLLARRAMLCWARLLLDRGQLAEAAQYINALQPYTRGASMLRAPLLELQLALRAARGEFAGMTKTLHTLLELAAERDRPCYERAQRFELQMRGVLGSDPRPTPLLEVAAESRRVAESRGDVVGLATASLDLCDAYVLAGEFERATAEAAGSQTLAESMGSPRFQLESEFYCAERDLGRLLRLGQSADIAPIAARRARALLGDEKVLDERDAAVCAAIRSQLGPLNFSTIRVGAELWEGAWGADSSSRTLWRPNGTRISLQRAPLPFRLLECVARLGGSATKEAIVDEVWEERTYHPQLHDPKLHVAVHRIRRLTEVDPKAPELLLATETGYELGGTVWWAYDTGAFPEGFAASLGVED